MKAPQVARQPALSYIPYHTVPYYHSERQMNNNNTSLDSSLADPFGFRHLRGTQRQRSSHQSATSLRSHSPLTRRPTTTTTKTTTATTTASRTPRNVSLSYSTTRNSRGNDSLPGENRYNPPQHYHAASQGSSPRRTIHNENASPQQSNARETEDFSKLASPMPRLPVMTNSFGEEVSPLRQESPSELQGQRGSLPPLVHTTETARRQTFVSNASSGSNLSHAVTATPNTRLSVASTSQLRFQLRQYQQQLEAAQEALEAAERKHEQHVQKMEQQHHEELEEWRKRYTQLEQSRRQEDLEREEQLVEREKELQRREDRLLAQQEDWNAFQAEEAERVQQEYAEKDQDLTRQINEKELSFSQWERDLRTRQAELELHEEDFQTRLVSLEKDRESEKVELDQKELDMRNREQAILAFKNENEEIRRKLQKYRSQLEARAKQLEKREEDIETGENVLAQQKQELEAAVAEMEAKNASYEAKYGLVEEALRDLAERREVEEARLEKALEEQEKSAAWIASVKRDAEKIKNEYQHELNDARTKHEALRNEIKEHEENLVRLKERIQVFVVEDRKCRQAAAERNKDVERSLEEKREELSRTKEALVAVRCKIDASQEELEKLRSQLSEARNQGELELRDLEERKQDAVKRAKEDAETETQNILEVAAAFLQEIAAKLTSDDEEEMEIDFTKPLQVDVLRETLDEIVELFDEKCIALLNEQDTATGLQKEYIAKLHDLGQTEDDSRWEIEKLKSLRDTSEKRLRQAQLELEDAKEGHRIEMQTLADQVVELESERDNLADKLEALNELERNASELRNHVREKDDSIENLRTQLAAAESKLSEMEAQKKSNERELGSLTTMIEEVEKQFEELEHRKVEMEQERKSLVALETRLCEDKQGLLREKERASKLEVDLKEQSDALESAKQAFEQRVDEFSVSVQKEAVRQFFEKPIRQDMESVSAAFSKWVRVAMFNSKQEYAVGEIKTLHKEMESLQEKLKYAQKVEGRLRVSISSASTQREELEAAKRSLEDELVSSKKETSAISEELEAVQTEKRQLEEVIEALRQDKVNSEKLHQDLDAANKRLRKMAQDLYKKKAELDLKEDDLGRELERCKEKQMKLDEYANQLAKRAEVFARYEADLEFRRQRCDELEARLRQLGSHHGADEFEEFGAP